MSASAGTSVAAVIAISFLAIAAVGLAVMAGGANDNGDPLIQGKYGMGTEFRYCEADDDGKELAFTMTIIGQSGSYYFLEFKEEADVDFDVLSFGQYAMIHKATGALRFADNVGKTSYEYNEKDVPLEKWKATMVEGDMKIEGDWMSVTVSFMFSSSSEDAIPYLFDVFISVDDGDELTMCSLALLNVVPGEPPVKYFKSKGLNTGFEYNMDGILMPEILPDEGRISYVHIADLSLGGKIGILYMVELENIFAFFYEISDDITLSDFLFSDYGDGDLEKTESIITIDGSVKCEKWTYLEDGMLEEGWIGINNGVVYLMKIWDGDELITVLELTGYIKNYPA